MSFGLTDEEVYASLPLINNVEHTHDWAPAPEGDELNPYYAAVTVIGWGLGTLYEYFMDVEDPPHAPQNLPPNYFDDEDTSSESEDEPPVRPLARERGYRFIGRAPSMKQYLARSISRAKSSR